MLRLGSGLQPAYEQLIELQWRDRSGISPASKPATPRLYLCALHAVNERPWRCFRIFLKSLQGIF